MNEFKFDLFEHEDKIAFTRLHFILILIAFILSIILIYQLGLLNNSQCLAILGYLGIPLFSSFIIFTFYRWFKVEPYTGKFTGILTFTEDGIHFHEQYFSYEDIKAIDFIMGDYFKKKEVFLLDYGLSNGTKNFVIIKFLDYSLKLNFQLQYKSQNKRLEPLLIHLHKLNKISTLKVLSILDITNYKEIQNFRKKLES